MQREDEPNAGVIDLLVIHGLWMRAPATWPLCSRLERAGLRCERFDYASVRHGPDRCIDAVAERLCGSAAGRVHLLGHSLGGLIALHACALSGARGLRIVCLGTPLRGSSVAQTLGRQAFTRWALGRSRELLCAGADAQRTEAEVGMIAGTRSRGLGRVVASLETPNDGTVSVAETRSDALADHISIDASHTGLLFSGAAAAHALQFLRCGRFDRGSDIEG